MNVRARVTVTVELVASSTWNPEVTAEQVARQAKDDAIAALRNGLVIGGLRMGRDDKTGAQVVGEPKVTMVIAELDK